MKKIIFLGLVLLSMVSCENQDNSPIGNPDIQKTVSKNIDPDVKELGSDSDYINFVKIILDESEKNYDIKLINNIIADNIVTEVEYKDVPGALGFKNEEEFKSSLNQKIIYLNNVNKKFNIKDFSNAKLADATVISIDVIKGFENGDDLCARERRNCRAIAIATAVGGHLACVGADLTIAGGILCHSAVAMLQYSMNDNCNIEYQRCINK